METNFLTEMVLYLISDWAFFTSTILDILIYLTSIESGFNFLPRSIAHPLKLYVGDLSWKMIDSFENVCWREIIDKM